MSALRLKLSILFLLLFTTLAYAQGGGGSVTPEGVITPGNCTKFGTTKFKVADAGAPCGAGAGTVSSVGLALPSIFIVSGSPVTTSGTLTGTLNTQTANTIFSGPASGAASTPTFRSIVNADLPDVISANTVGSATVVSIITYNSKGLLTTVSSATITPAIGSITGLGTGVATALSNTAGGAGGFALVGTTPPTGAAGGDLTGTYPNPTLATTQTSAHTWSSPQTYSGTEINSTNGAASLSPLLFSGTILTGGSGTTNFPHLFVQPSGATAVTTLSTSGTVFGANTATSFGGNYLAFYANGAAVGFSVNSSFNLTTVGAISGQSLRVNSNTGLLTLGSANDVIVSRGGAANVLQLGNVDAASPVAQTLRAQSVVAGTNTISGANLTIQGSLSTGLASGGDIILKTTANVAAATTQNVGVEVIRLTGGTNNIKFKSSTTGAGIQTFTNSPCGTLTTEQYIPIEITGQTGIWYIAACQ